MANGQPENPNIKNPFLEFSKNFTNFMKYSESVDRSRNVNTEKLMKEMAIQYKLLRTAYEKGNITAKKGKEEDLYNDKGFFKLLELMDGVDSKLEKVIDKYLKGKNLVKGEKVDLSKFLEGMQESLRETKEKVGIPTKDVLNNFKTLLNSSDASVNYQLDLLDFLREYAKEDIAVSEDLKTLISEVLRSNKISDEDRVRLNQELSNTIEEYSRNQSTAFSPFARLRRTLDTTNLTMQGMVTSLTSNQQRQGGNQGGNQGGGGHGFAERIQRFVTERTGEATTASVRNLAVGASEMLPEPLKPVAAITASSAPLISEAVMTALTANAGWATFKNLGSAVGPLAKTMTVLKGVGMVAKPLALGLAGIEGVTRATEEINRGKGNVLDKTLSVPTKFAEGFTSSMTLGLSDKLFGALKPSKEFQKRLESGQVKKMWDFNSGVKNNKADGTNNILGGMGNDTLGDVIKEENRKIYGPNLDLGQIFTNSLKTLFPFLGEGKSTEQIKIDYANEQAGLAKKDKEFVNTIKKKETYTEAGGGVGGFLGGLVGKKKEGEKLGTEVGAKVYDIGKTGFHRGKEIIDQYGNRRVLSTNPEDKAQRTTFGKNSRGEDITSGDIERGKLAKSLNKNKEFESLGGKSSWYRPSQFSQDIAYGKKGTSTVLNEFAGQGAKFTLSGAMGTSASKHTGKGSGKGHESGSKFDIVPKTGETLEGLYEKALKNPRFSEVSIENKGTDNAHVDVQIAKSVYENVKKNEELVANAKKKEVLVAKARPDVIVAPPKTPPKEQGTKIAPAPSPVVASAPPDRQKSERKTKSDHAMVDMYNVHGVLG